MYKTIFTLISLACFSISYAGNEYLKMLLHVKAERIARYSISANYGPPILVRMPFNSDSIINPQLLTKLAGGIRAARIDLVYTAYRESETFEQPVLNRSRMQHLMKYAPALFDNELTEWHFIAQTGGTTLDSAMAMFHGFVIYPKEEISAAEVEKEIALITLAMDSTEVFLEENDSTCIIKAMRLKSRYVPTGYYLPHNKRIWRKAHRSKTRSMRYPVMEVRQQRDTIVRYDSVRCYEGIIDSRIYGFLPDSVVIKVMERHPEWVNKLVVTDVTGSMAPYTSQLLVWYKLRELKAGVKMFEFFNDGDNTPQQRKRVGSTGGIYFSQPEKKYEGLEKTMTETMRKGDGGDAPENNIEALLKGIETCPECADVVMIADNWAPVKDIALLDKVKKPIKIILCGVEDGIINADYLNIARKTGGSIHLLDQDINDLMKLNEGETIKLGTRQYKIVGGKFTVVGFI